MRVFVTDIRKARVLNLQLNQPGTIRFTTRVEVRGNHLKGNVPVKIVYTTCFVPDEEFWEQDQEYPDEEPYSVSYPREFLAEDERDAHCENFYQILEGFHEDHF